MSGTSSVCLVIWSVWSIWTLWSIWLVWFNQIIETDQMNKTGWRTASASVQDYALGIIRER